MATIVIKNLPDDLHAGLKLQALRHNRSVTKEVITLIESGIAAARRAPQAPPPDNPSSSKVSTSEVNERALVPRQAANAVAEPRPIYAAEPAEPDRSAEPDGREALRAALVMQADGSYVNVLGIDAAEFFETLNNLRKDVRMPNISRLFDEQG
jgi:plasmid stability protein